MKTLLVVCSFLLAVCGIGTAQTTPIAESQNGPVKVMVLPPFPFPLFAGMPNGPMIAVWDISPETTNYVVTVDYICRRNGSETYCQRILTSLRIQPCSLIFLLDDVVRITKVTAQAFRETGTVTLDLEK
jgi:hypothetical protein